MISQSIFYSKPPLIIRVKQALLALALCGMSMSVVAENRWVTDEFEVMLRSGTSTKQSIVRQLRSGTQVEYLDEDKEAGYTKVRLGSGTEGWVLTRYLKRNPTARLQLPDAQAKLAKSESVTKELRRELAEVKKDRQQLQSQVQDLQSNNSSTQKQLERVTTLSADTIKVDDQNRQLKIRLSESELQIDELTADNVRLGSRADREWFLIGGAVLVVGLLLGLILPRISWKKKSSWSDF